MQAKRHRVKQLQAIQQLRSLACDDAQAKVSDLQGQANALQADLQRARAREAEALRLHQVALSGGPTFDPNLYRLGMAFAGQVRDESQRIAGEVTHKQGELGEAREQWLQARVGEDASARELRRRRHLLQRAETNRREQLQEESAAALRQARHGSV